jgi:hypothetical protein
MRHQIPLSLLALCALLLVGTTSSAAPIYKWEDAEGRIHYEDTRPPEGEVKVIKPPTVYRGEPAEPAQPQPAAQGGTASPAPVASADPETRARKCAESREALAQGQGATRMYTLDAQGNRTYLSTAEIEAHVAKLQEAVASWCKEP